MFCVVWASAMVSSDIRPCLLCLQHVLFVCITRNNYCIWRLAYSVIDVSPAKPCVDGGRGTSLADWLKVRDGLDVDWVTETVTSEQQLRRLATQGVYFVCCYLLFLALVVLKRIISSVYIHWRVGDEIRCFCKVFIY